jgi:hypothetical protein
MWFKGFIVAALTAALTVGPFAGMRAYADPPETVNWEKVSADMATIPDINLLAQVWDDVHQDAIIYIEAMLDGVGCDEQCLLGQLGPELDSLYQALFGRDRVNGEYTFTIAADLPIGTNVTTTSKAGEPVSFVKLADISSWDFADPVIKAEFDNNNYEFVTSTFVRMDRALLSVEGPAGSRVVDAVLLYTPLHGGNSTMTILPLSDAPDGQIPPTVMVSLTWWNWGCAISGLLWAAATSVCIASAVGCPGGCIPCCLLVGKSCCATAGFGVNVLNACFGWDHVGILFVSNAITAACAFVP